MNNKTIKYYDRLASDFGITDKILNDLRPVIKDRLKGAAASLIRVKSTISDPKLLSTKIQGINQCVHLAIGILFAGKKNEDKIELIFKKITTEIEFKNLDPTDVAVTAVLKYLLDYLKRVPEAEERSQSELCKQIDAVRDTFNQINWLLDVNAVRKLDELVPSR